MQNVAELLRLIHNVIRIGTISSVDHEGARCRVKVGELETNGLRWIATRAGTTLDWDPPTVGEQVVLLSPGGDLSAGVILTGLFQQAHAAPAAEAALWKRVFPDGAEIQYDHESHVADITLPGGAVLNLASDGGVNITGDVAINGNLDVTGNAHADGNVSDAVRSMVADRDIYNQHKHPETGGETEATQQQQ